MCSPSKRRRCCESLDACRNQRCRRSTLVSSHCLSCHERITERIQRNEPVNPDAGLGKRLLRRSVKLRGWLHSPAESRRISKSPSIHDPCGSGVIWDACCPMPPETAFSVGTSWSTHYSSGFHWPLRKRTRRGTRLKSR